MVTILWGVTQSIQRGDYSQHIQRQVGESEYRKTETINIQKFSKNVKGCRDGSAPQTAPG